MYQATILKAYGREYFFCFHFLMWKNGGIIMHDGLKSEKMQFKEWGMGKPIMFVAFEK